MNNRETIEALLKKRKYSESLPLINDYIKNYEFDIDGYELLLIAKTKNFSKDINYLFDENKEYNTIELIKLIRETIPKLKLSDKSKEKIEDYILDLTKELNTSIEGKKPLELSENLVAGIITIVVLLVIILIIVL